MTLNLLSVTNIVKQENINLLGSDNAYFTYAHEYNTNKYPTKTINTQHYDGTTKIVNTAEYTYNK